MVGSARIGSTDREAAADESLASTRTRDRIHGAHATPDAGAGAPLACADLPLCDDCEAGAAGAPPAAPRTVASPSCSNGGTVTMDDQVAHSGSCSVRVTAGGSYCDHVFFAVGT